jgi:hypothetical protein
MALVTFVLTCLRFYYQQAHGIKESLDSQKVSDEQRIQEEQEILKEYQFQESIQGIMNATLGVHNTKTDPLFAVPFSLIWT